MAQVEFTWKVYRHPDDDRSDTPEPGEIDGYNVWDYFPGLSPTTLSAQSVEEARRSLGQAYLGPDQFGVSVDWCVNED